MKVINTVQYLNDGGKTAACNGGSGVSNCGVISLSGSCLTPRSW